MTNLITMRARLIRARFSSMFKASTLSTSFTLFATTITTAKINIFEIDIHDDKKQLLSKLFNLVRNEKKKQLTAYVGTKNYKIS